MSRTGSLNIEGLRFLPLHGLLSQEDQFEVFRNEGYVKVIFSTRIAETALTINDITTVIDIGIDRYWPNIYIILDSSTLTKNEVYRLPF